MSWRRVLARPRKAVHAVLGLALALTLVALLALGWNWNPGASEATESDADLQASSALTLAVIGYVPSTPFQVENFPQLVNQISSRADNAFIAHLGNIKGDGTPCSDAYYRQIVALFESFSDPVVYTPGQHDWANCHRPQNGGTSPLNRLGGLKNFFFSSPNTGIAQRSERYHNYASDGYAENIRFAIRGTSFAAIHVVGSDNGLQPWTGQRTANKEQREAVADRTRSAIRVLRDTFASASAQSDRSVVVLTQADMFPPDRRQHKGLVAAYAPVVSALAAEAAAFPGEVYLFNSGSGVYRSDQPLATKSAWRKFYKVTAPPTDRLHRVTVDGAAQATNYLRVTIDYRAADPVRWARVPISG